MNIKHKRLNKEMFNFIQITQSQRSVTKKISNKIVWAEQ